MKKPIYLVILIGLAMSSAAHAQLPGVKLIVNGAEPATGTIEATIFDSAEDFLKEPLFQETGEVSEDGRFEAEFVGLEEGVYAIVVVHDANDNGVFDAGILGFGGESVGYSNNVSSWFGRPNFTEAGFTVDQAEQIVEINFD